MKAILPSVLLLCLLLGAPGAAIAQTEAVTDLTEFTFRQVRLTPTDLLDSVLAHRPQNYPAFMYYGGRMDASITASGSGDTLFYGSRPVWLERGEFGVYSLYGRAEDTGRQLVNRATPEQTNRIITIRLYPVAKGLGDMLQSIRGLLKKHDGFYGTSYRDSQRILHLIMPVDASVGHWLTRIAASKFSADTVIAYLSLEIGQDDWSLQKQEWISLSTDAATAQRFKAARKYTELSALLAQVVHRRGMRYIRSGHSFVPLPGRKGYRLALSDFEDNLYNLSKKMPERGKNEDASLFRMRVLIDKPIAQLPNEDLVEAKSGDFVMSEDEGTATGE